MRVYRYMCHCICDISMNINKYIHLYIIYKYIYIYILSQWGLPHIRWLIVRRRCATKPNHTTATDEIAHLL